MSDQLATLLRQAQSGDRVALNQLLERLRPHLEMAAQRFEDPAHPSESVADLVQEAGVLAWKNLASFRGGESDDDTERKLRVWLSQIVKRAGIDARRAARAQRRSPIHGIVRSLSPANPTDSTPGLEPPANDATPSANVRADESIEIIRAALGKIEDPLSRDIAQIVFVEGQTLRQASERLKLTYDQVRHRYHKLIEILSKELEGLQ